MKHAPQKGQETLGQTEEIFQRAFKGHQKFHSFPYNTLEDQLAPLNSVVSSKVADSNPTLSAIDLVIGCFAWHGNSPAGGGSGPSAVIHPANHRVGTYKCAVTSALSFDKLPSSVRSLPLGLLLRTEVSHGRAVVRMLAGTSGTKILPRGNS